MRGCREARNQISLFLDGETAGDLAEEAQGHLRVCSACRAWRAEVEQTRSLLARVALAEPPQDLADRIRSRLGEDLGGRDWVGTGRFCRKLIPLAAAALLLFSVLAVLWSPSAQPPENLARGSVDQSGSEDERLSNGSAETELMHLLAMDFGIDGIAFRELDASMEN